MVFPASAAPGKTLVIPGWSNIFTADFRIDFDNFKVFKSNVEQNNRSGAEAEKLSIYTSKCQL
jgi:hypothetical protein